MKPRSARFDTPERRAILGRPVLTLYLAALIFGLGVFLVQLLASSDAGHHDGALLGAGGQDSGGQPGSGGHGSGGFDGADVAHADVAHADVAHADVAHGEGPLAHVGHDAHAGAGSAGIFTSFRFYMFAAIAFGAVGAPVTAFGATPAGLTFGVALGTALVVGWLAALGFRAIGRDTLSSDARQADLRGQIGRVLIACEKGRAGKVRLTVRGQIIDVAATTDEPRLELGAAVLVEEVVSNRVHVCRAPSELLPG